jgi:WXG100 family type VII secretion target
MAKTVQLNYDELTTIVKKFKENGEDYTKLHSNLRQRVQDLHKDWIGEGAEKFFEEMEVELLPALERLARAFFFSQDTLQKIMRIINEKDTETAGFFKGEFDLFGNIGSGISAGVSSGLPDPGSSGDDFGASQFEQALPQQGAGNSEQATNDFQTSDQQDANRVSEASGSTAGTAGGGGGGSYNQGTMGDLNHMGTGVGAQTSAGGSGPGSGSPGGGQPMPDHIYEAGSNAQEGSGGMNTSGSGNPGEADQDSSRGESAAAAGIAGVAGSAAAGVTAKIRRGRKK